MSILFLCKQRALAHPPAVTVRQRAQQVVGLTASAWGLAVEPWFDGPPFTPAAARGAAPRQAAAGFVSLARIL